MRQVGAQELAATQTIDPRQLPVPLNQISRKALIGVSHVWVLHRGLVIRAVAACMVLLAVIGIYHARDTVVSLGDTVYRLVQGEFAHAGFGVEKIQVSGQKLTSDSHIATLMAFSAGTSTLTFDVQKAAARLHWLRAVDSATVRKIYPDQIIVELTERDPVLRWRIGDAVYLVDNKGEAIAKDTGEYTDLPLVVGDGAADDALIMINSLGRHDILKKDLAAISRIGDRRWDLIYYTGLRVQLPEQGVAQALNQLEMYQRDYALLDRDVTLIDLRVPGMVALKANLPEPEKDAKKKKKP